MDIIYVDSLFILNLAADYLLLLCTGRICSLQLKRLRYLAAAALGSVYSVVVFLPGWGFLSQPGYKLLMGAAMAGLAFGTERRPIGCIGAFMVLSAAVGGMFWALGLNLGAVELNFKLFVFGFALFYGLLRLISSRTVAQAGKSLAKMEIHMSGKQCKFTVLVDSGNCLYDPATGQRVAIACPHGVNALFPEGICSIRDPVDFVTAAAGLPGLEGRIRLLPYSSLGGSGLLPVFRPDRVLIDGEDRKELLIGIAKSACGAGFEGII